MTEHALINRVNSLDFEQQVLAADLPVLIDISAAYCAPCRAARPALEQIAKQHGGKLIVVEVDGDESPDLVLKLGARGFPTFILYRGGQELSRSVGYRGPRQLQEMIALAVQANSA